MQNTAFYQSHLDRVSRSFAFCIQQLEAPMQSWVSLSYLLCRILDTVEDANWGSAEARDVAFRAFDRLIQAPCEATRICWASAFPAALPEGEKRLLADSGLLFDDLQALPQAVRDVIYQAVHTMSQGMQHYAAQRDQQGALRLASLTEVNRYCYFVAGVVGQLLTRLFFLMRPDFVPHEHLLRDAFHFGLFLQKINLLKDQHTDEAEGRFLVPQRRVLLASLRENLEGSVAYLTALPADARGYRVFCAWSMFLGMASLPHMEAAYRQQDGGKISRKDAMQLMLRIADIAQDNAALRAELAPYLTMLPPCEELQRTPDWFCLLSGDALRPSELSELSVL